MDERELQRTLRELYSGDPAEFTAARDALSTQARERGDKHLAARLKKFRKPTTAAWAINRMVATEPDLVEDLLHLGEQLRAAQHDLRADQLRALADRRSTLLRRLAARAVELAEGAGHPLSEQARQQVEQTLTAALSDPQAGEEVRQGTLSRPLEFSGFALGSFSAEAIRRVKQNKTTEQGKPGAPPKHHSLDQPLTPPPEPLTGAVEGESEVQRHRRELRQRRDHARRQLRIAEDKLNKVQDARLDVEEHRDDLRAELRQLDNRLANLATAEEEARQRIAQAQQEFEAAEQQLRREEDPRR